jgi:hypothetical protein
MRQFCLALGKLMANSYTLTNARIGYILAEAGARSCGIAMRSFARRVGRIPPFFDPTAKQ